jgi:hypothetical protein
MGQHPLPTGKTMRQVLRSLPALVMLACSAALLSCSGGTTTQGSGDDCDYILAAGLQSGGTAAIVTDRQCPSFLSEDWEVQVDFASPTTGAGEPPPDTQLARFYMAHYDVTYRNDRTGGATAGVDVPFPIRVPIASVVDVGDLLALDNWPILEPGQKLATPLNNSSFYPPGGVPMTAFVTFWGHPVSNADRWCFVTIEWNFTIFDSGVPQTGNCE